MTDIASENIAPREIGFPVATDATAKHAVVIPGHPDMWAFVLFESFLFTAYLTVYMLYRNRNLDLFLRAQAHLDVRHGVFNTLLLLVSSWSIARCVQAARERTFETASKHAFTTLFFGVLFMASKIFEWTTKLEHGLDFSTNQFFTFYFFITGIHFIHLLIGFVALGVVIYELRSPARRSQSTIETCATYWHTTDFLWVIIFSLLYVVR